MTAVELAIVGAPKAFWGMEDSTAKVLHEWEGFCLVVTEDGTCGFCEQAFSLADSIGTCHLRRECYHHPVVQV